MATLADPSHTGTLLWSCDHGLSVLTMTKA